MTITSRAAKAFTLIEMLVYLGVLFVITGVGFTALYRCMDASTALRRNESDIVGALRAGENWRADVRAAGGKIELRTSADGPTFVLPGVRGEVSYLFSRNSISRRLGANGWSPVLDNVKNSTFIEESRDGVNAWKWEVELKPRSKRLTRLRPLFTFIAVPSGGAAK